MEKIDLFKAELRALLEKHNAGIACNVYGDTHGLDYEMVVCFGQSDKWKEYVLNDGNGIDYSDIQINAK